MQIILGEVVVEKVTKGKNFYQVATVNYTSNGESRVQKIMSFSNPDTFKNIQTFSAGDALDVTVTKNDAGYNQWAKIAKVDAAAATPATGGKVLGSQYETREERQERQLHIVRQSCLGYAVGTLTPGATAALNPEVVKALAEEYVDYVYGTDEIMAEMAANNG
jgi:hypothetical protein